MKGPLMNKDVWDRIAEAAQGEEAIDSADVALALLDLRAMFDRLHANFGRCQDSLHHVDKHLGKLASACHVSYSRVTAELLGD